MSSETVAEQMSHRHLSRSSWAYFSDKQIMTVPFSQYCVATNPNDLEKPRSVQIHKVNFRGNKEGSVTFKTASIGAQVFNI